LNNPSAAAPVAVPAVLIYSGESVLSTNTNLLPQFWEQSDDFPFTAEDPSRWLRLFEILFASAVLIAAAPLLLAVFISVKAGTPGPALFWQYRVGKDRKPFRFVKFRTMYADARQRFPHLYAYQYSRQDLDELKFKVRGDPRVTPQGKWLRKSTLDELPNFWNVLTGEMALVGPRPEIPEMLPYYNSETVLKFRVRPGITGLAQTSGRGCLGFHETVNMDMDYVKNRTFLLDLKILFTTLTKIVTRDGAF